MKAALVTGVSGYLGGHVARRLLAEGWHVVALTRPGSRLAYDLKGRVLRADYDGTPESIGNAFGSAPIDVVVHLASAVVAVHAPNELDAILDANIRLPAQLLEAMRQGTCKRFVNTGTFWQHRNADDYAPVNLYAATKQAFEDLARTYVDNDGISFATLVLFDNYGDDDPRRKIVQLLTEAVSAPEPLPLSPGDQLLDLTHAKDVANAFLVMCERMLRPSPARWERFRVSGTRLTLKQLVTLIERVAGMRPNVAFGAYPYRDREIMVPVERSLAPLPGWVPCHALDEGIARVLAAQTGNPVA